jgi:hypothetical protein
MTIDFSSTMRRYPDQEIIRIIQNGKAEGIDPAAITAAQHELSSRGRTQEQVDATVSEVKTADANQTPQEEQELSKFSRIAFLILGFLMFPLAALVAIALAVFGYKRKSQQAWLSIGVGLIPVAIIAIVLIVLNPR